MSVYFVYRCHYQGPSEKSLKRFEDDTVLDWFRNHWRRLAEGGPDNAYDRVCDLFGHSIYGFHSLFRKAGEQSLPPPQTDEQLDDYLKRYLYVEGAKRYSPHLLQVLTDDDELEMAYYFFDDHYLAKHRKRAAFLLHDDWKLPGGQGAGRFRATEKAEEFIPTKGKGATWLVHLTYYDSANLGDLDGPYRIKGVRLPDLARHLLRRDPEADWPSRGGWPLEPRVLRAGFCSVDDSAPPVEQQFLHAIRANPDDDATWNAYSDWLTDNGKPATGLVLLERGLRKAARCPLARIGGGGWSTRLLGPPEAAERDLEALAKSYADKDRPNTSLFHVDEHVAQACLHVAQWGKDALYHQWIYFDDVWASANADLANAILRFSRRWDVLTPD